MLTGSGVGSERLTLTVKLIPSPMLMLVLSTASLTDDIDMRLFRETTVIVITLLLMLNTQHLMNFIKCHKLIFFIT